MSAPRSYNTLFEVACTAPLKYLPCGLCGASLRKRNMPGDPRLQVMVCPCCDLLSGAGDD